MKHSKHHDHPRHTAAEPQPVRFEFFDPAATAVAIAGTFNDWQPAAKAMHPVGSGHWLKETVLPPGTYEYCFVVDGQWRPDPAARERVANPYGGQNSILKVARTPAAARLDAAENTPLKTASHPNSKSP
jgi:1,4-alpha-glucan branching enzyme